MTLAACPIDHVSSVEQSSRKTQAAIITAQPSLEQDSNGVWQIKSFDLCRQILRSDTTRQAGFSAEQLGPNIKHMREPILFLEGERHKQLRSQTAKFFTPSTTNTKHKQIMESLTNELISRFERSRKADLSQLSLELAVGVAAEVIGLSGSPRRALAARIGAFAFNPSTISNWQKKLMRISAAYKIMSFFYLDVRPAIHARLKKPQDDLISHVLGIGYKPFEVLGECVTYGAAGMLTTREFISVCVWHLLERPKLRARYLVASETERHAILGEILRLEPVIGTLKRRTTAEMQLENQLIPAGALLHLHVYAANADPATVGQNPNDLCPARPLAKSVQEPVLSFGDGHHRCPGSFLAFAETDVFLLRLLALPIRMVSTPKVTFNPTLEGYEIRNLQLQLEANI
jgi:cytochrome P450